VTQPSCLHRHGREFNGTGQLRILGACRRLAARI
jgi:hypothetical protein